MWVALEELFKAVLFKATSGLVGWRAWLAKLLIKYALKAVRRLINYAKVSKEVKENLKKYEKVINDPNATADDIADAGDDFLK
jgi:hypothetical protein